MSVEEKFMAMFGGGGGASMASLLMGVPESTLE
jgi:hypothetical protein